MEEEKHEIYLTALLEKNKTVYYLIIFHETGWFLEGPDKLLAETLVYCLTEYNQMPIIPENLLEDVLEILEKTLPRHHPLKTAVLKKPQYH